METIRSSIEMPKNPDLKESKKICTLDVDLKEAWDTESEFEIIVEALKKAGIYKRSLLYCGFDGSRKFQMDSFFAGEERNLKEGITSGNNYNPIEYAFKQKIPAIAIVDSEKTEITEEDLLCHKASDPSAVLAIIHLKR
jgi:hypothetical protein